MHQFVFAEIARRISAKQKLRFEAQRELRETFEMSRNEFEHNIVRTELELIGNLAHGELADDSTIELADEVHNLREANETTQVEIQASVLAKAHLEEQLHETNTKLQAAQEELDELHAEKEKENAEKEAEIERIAAAALLLGKAHESDSEKEKSDNEGGSLLAAAFVADRVIDAIDDDHENTEHEDAEYVQADEPHGEAVLLDLAEKMVAEEHDETVVGTVVIEHEEPEENHGLEDTAFELINEKIKGSDDEHQSNEEDKDSEDEGKAGVAIGFMPDIEQHQQEHDEFDDKKEEDQADEEEHREDIEGVILESLPILGAIADEKHDRSDEDEKSRKDDSEHSDEDNRKGAMLALGAASLLAEEAVEDHGEASDPNDVDAELQTEHKELSDDDTKVGERLLEAGTIADVGHLKEDELVQQDAHADLEQAVEAAHEKDVSDEHEGVKLGAAVEGIEALMEESLRDQDEDHVASEEDHIDATPLDNEETSDQVLEQAAIVAAEVVEHEKQEDNDHGADVQGSEHDENSDVEVLLEPNVAIEALAGEDNHDDKKSEGEVPNVAIEALAGEDKHDDKKSDSEVHNVDIDALANEDKHDDKLSDGEKEEESELKSQVLVLSTSLVELQAEYFQQNASKEHLEEQVGILQAELAQAQEQAHALQLAEQMREHNEREALEAAAAAIQESMEQVNHEEQAALEGPSELEQAVEHVRNSEVQLQVAHHEINELHMQVEALQGVNELSRSQSVLQGESGAAEISALKKAINQHESQNEKLGKELKHLQDSHDAHEHQRFGLDIDDDFY